MSEGRPEVFSAKEWEMLTPHLAASARQGEVLRGLFRGLRDREIADEMEISYWTLRTHMAKLFEKFGVEDRNELVLAVFQRAQAVCGELKSLREVPEDNEHP